MAKFIETCWGDKAGNTTIDWMVLTAGLVLLGTAAMASVGTSSQGLANDTTTTISQIDTNV